MRYISLFSGIEAASVAFGPLGWEPICFAEVDQFASAVLAHHFSGTPNVGDVTAYDWQRHRGECDLVVGGPPCQAFSVAGKRLSLADDRGNMSLAYVRAVDAIDPLWCLTENVPGWLSTGDNAFGCFLAAMVGADAALIPNKGQRWTDAGVVTGPRRTCAWRILDAQYFGVPQRRRRVFVVAVRGSGNWRCAEAIFPIGQSLRGDSAPRREAGQGVALPVTSRVDRGGEHREADGNNLIAATIGAENVRHTTGMESGADLLVPVATEIKHADATLSVRRLLPVETERLQGLPDNWTNIPYRGKPAADGPRYRAIGNSFAVPVVRWIGERIETFEWSEQ